MACMQGQIKLLTTGTELVSSVKRKSNKKSKLKFTRRHLRPQ